MKKRMSSFGIPGLLAGLVVAGACEPVEDVPVQPLPSMERLSPEARYGLPEVKGVWRFAGWQVEPGDSALLDRSYPAFGALDLQEQRLDSVAGMLSLYGGNAPVVGEVRRDGWFALATITDSTATAYVAGRYARDTLFLEMTSVVAPEDWPSGATGVFVREGDGLPGPIAWFRGTGPMAPGALPDSSAIADSLVAVPVVAGASAEGGAIAGMGEGMTGGPSGTPSGSTPEASQAGGGRSDAERTSPSRPDSSPAPPPPPSPSAAPEPGYRPETERGPRLLGEPVTPP